MVRIRSLAKELRQLEKQRQTTSAAAHADPVAEPAAPASASSDEQRAKQVSTTPLEDETARCQASPPAQTDEVSTASSSSSAAGNGESILQQQRGAAGQASNRASPTTSQERAPRSGSGEQLFALGGSRFDILVHGAYADGSACRKSDVRKATKVCSSGKTALQRSQEDLEAMEEASKDGLNDGGKDGDDSAAAAPPAPPLGTSCSIPTRPPYKRLLPQPFSHVLVCDYEATCASGSVHYPHEIIEFPVVVLDTATLSIVAEFHRYVRPLRNPKLTPFCTELTGITQEMVDQADPLPVVVQQFQQWLEEAVYPLCRTWSAYYGADKLSHNLRAEQRRFVYDERTELTRGNVDSEAMICMATDGPWDMRRFMHECSVMRDGVDFPPVCYRYINVRHSYSDHFKCRQVKLTHMLKKLSMSFQGRRHSGIDDTRNIARVLAELLARGYRVHHVSSIKYSHRGDAFLASNQAAQELLSEFGEADETHTCRHGANTHQRAATKRTGKKK